MDTKNSNNCDNNHVSFSEHESLFNFAEQHKLSDVVKCSLIKLVILGSGADKVLKDGKSQKTCWSFDHDHHGSSSDQSEKNVISSSKKSPSCTQIIHENSSDKTRERARAKLDNSYLEIKKDKFDIVSSKVNSYFPLYFVNFLALLAIRFISFQFSLLVSVLTFPIWLSDMSLFMFFIFPFQVLRYLRRYLTKKFLSMWGIAHVILATSVSKSVKVQKSFALKLGWALIRSMYVCSMLIGLLLLGFVFGELTMQRLVEQPIQMKETLNFDYTKANPVAFVPLAPYTAVEYPASLLYNNNVEAGQKRSDARVIPYNHKLQLSVSLTLPESDYNRKLGIFQVKVEFLSANGMVTASSSHPCMLRFKSQSIRIVETLLRSAPLIAGWQSESQVLNIRMNELTEGIEPTACLKVTLEQRAVSQQGDATGTPQVYDASLALETELPQLKRLIWCWKRTLFVCTSVMAFCVELLFVSVFCRSIFVPKGVPPNIGGYRKKICSFNLVSVLNGGV